MGGDSAVSSLGGVALTSGPTAPDDESISREREREKERERERERVSYYRTLLVCTCTSTCTHVYGLSVGLHKLTTA